MSSLTAFLAAAIVVAAEGDSQFDPTKVTPGPAGFVMTAIFGAAVIVLGFLLVSRLRRNAYRHEVRESIEAELAEMQPGDGSASDPSPVADDTREDAPESEADGPDGR